MLRSHYRFLKWIYRILCVVIVLVFGFDVMINLFGFAFETYEKAAGQSLGLYPLGLVGFLPFLTPIFMFLLYVFIVWLGEKMFKVLEAKNVK